ncbi:hypothetical protein OKW34_004257 [Paraburkholderia youngii]|uniref:hypothetical protein n=1 Tax=Paraburkholderia youngii TaxID=2782701 RepID=UPI003D23364A
MAEVNSLILPSPGPFEVPIHSPSLSLVVAVYTPRAILMLAGIGQLSYVSAAAQYDAPSARATTSKILIIGFVSPLCKTVSLSLAAAYSLHNRMR